MRFLIALLFLIGTASAQPIGGGGGCNSPYGSTGVGCGPVGSVISAPSQAIAPSPGLTFTTLAGGTVGGAAIAGSGSYFIAAPSGLTNATWGGGCSGPSTVAGFSAAAGSWSATFTVPAGAGVACTITVTGTGSNTATAVSPGVTIASGACSNQLDFTDSCNSQYIFAVVK